jgi:hypothetical protein
VLVVLSDAQRWLGACSSSAHSNRCNWATTSHAHYSHAQDNMIRLLAARRVACPRDRTTSAAAPAMQCSSNSGV